MRYAIIESGIVVNVIESGPEFAEQIGAIPAANNGTNAAIGGMWDGKVFGPAPVDPGPVPAAVTRAQGKAALIKEGLWPQVLAYVDAIADPTEKALAEVALNDTMEWLRTSPFLASVAVALNLTDEQLDDLFRVASTIEL